MKPNNKPLSKEQLQILGILATEAYDAQELAGSLHLPAEVASDKITARRKFWKATVVARVTQRVQSTKDMVQDEYLPLKAEFLRLGAKSKEAFDTALRDVRGSACERDPGCAWLREMYDFMQQAGVKDGYAIAIMKARKWGSDIRALKEWQLKQLHDTVVNRCRAKLGLGLGLGEAANRNKLQREAAKTSKVSAPDGEHEPKRRDYILNPAKKYAPRERTTNPESQIDQPF